jgi:hypothetical protein
LIIRHKIIIKPDSFGFKELQKLSKNCPGYKESIGGKLEKWLDLIHGLEKIILYKPDLSLK